MSIALSACCMTDREVVESVLRDIMPEDAHEKVKHKAYIGVTLLQTPVPRCSLFNNFNDRDDFIQALLASCYIPVYFDQGKMGMRYRDRWVCDGGISNFVPTPPGEVCYSILSANKHYERSIIADLFYCRRAQSKWRAGQTLLAYGTFP